MITLSKKQEEDLFITARERITPLEHWTICTLGETSNGKTVTPTHVAASRWCAYGSLEKSLFSLVPHASYKERNRFIENAFTYDLLEACEYVTEGRWSSLSKVNDLESHEKVLEVLDYMIDHLQKREI